jgi:hypothetical protein
MKTRVLASRIIPRKTRILSQVYVSRFDAGGKCVGGRLAGECDPSRHVLRFAKFYTDAQTALQIYFHEVFHATEAESSANIDHAVIENLAHAATDAFAAILDMDEQAGP